MATLSLPLIREDIPLKKALDKMTAAGTSGIVWQRDDRFLLYRAPKVVLAIAGGKRSLAQLPEEDVGPQRVPAPNRGMHLPSSALDAIHLNLSDSLAQSLSQVAAQCYCPECEEPGEEGVPCTIDRVLPVCS